MEKQKNLNIRQLEDKIWALISNNNIKDNEDKQNTLNNSNCRSCQSCRNCRSCCGD